MVWGFSQGHAGGTTEVVTCEGAAWACRACSEQNRVTASSIANIILDVFSLFMLVCLKGLPADIRRANVSIKLLPAPALVNRMNV